MIHQTTMNILFLLPVSFAITKVKLGVNVIGPNVSKSRLSCHMIGRQRPSVTCSEQQMHVFLQKRERTDSFHSQERCILTAITYICQTVVFYLRYILHFKQIISLFKTLNLLKLEGDSAVMYCAISTSQRRYKRGAFWTKLHCLVFVCF